MNENKKMSLNEQKLRRKVRRMIKGMLQEDMASEIAADFPRGGGTGGLSGHTPEYEEFEGTPESAFEEPVADEHLGLPDVDELSPAELYLLGLEEGEELEEEKPLKEWYNDTLHEALLKKFKIKK